MNVVDMSDDRKAVEKHPLGVIIFCLLMSLTVFWSFGQWIHAYGKVPCPSGTYEL
jgi:hypothetical protein